MIADTTGAKKSFRFRAAAFAVGIVLVGIGISLMVSARLGVAPADVMSTGGAERLDIGVGTMGWISGAVFTALAWLLGRPPSWGTLVGTVLVGQCVNVFLEIVPEPEALMPRSLMLAGGLIVIYAGIAVGVATTLGTGPVELLMLALADRGMSMQIARWGLEAVVLVIGAVLGGQMGIGTLIFVLLTGPVLARLLPPVVRFMGTTVLLAPTALDA